MKDILKSLFEWSELQKQAALATVLQTWGSSPRQAGAHMAVEQLGEFVGSVSGGCVESAVVQEAMEVIATGQSKRIKYGVSDDAAWDVGLACGGEIEIFISPISWEDITPILDTIEAGEPCTYAIDLDKAGILSSLQRHLHSHKLPFLDQNSDPERLVLHVAPDPEIVIIGGVNISQKLVPLAKLLGYKTTIIDPRKSFADPQRFPQADLVLHCWPEEGLKKARITTSTAIVILSHDDKIDIPALETGLQSDAFYIGALGSKKTQTRRKKSLLDAGIAAEMLERIHGPIGLDLGAKDPTEIALSILAEITAVANLNRGKIG